MGSGIQLKRARDTLTVIKCPAEVCKSTGTRIKSLPKQGYKYHTRKHSTCKDRKTIWTHEICGTIQVSEGIFTYREFRASKINAPESVHTHRVQYFSVTTTREGYRNRSKNNTVILLEAPCIRKYKNRGVRNHGNIKKRTVNLEKNIWSKSKRWHVGAKGYQRIL